MGSTSSSLQVQMTQAEPDSHNLFDFNSDNHQVYEFSVDSQFHFLFADKYVGLSKIQTPQPNIHFSLVRSGTGYALTQPHRDFTKALESESDSFCWEAVGSGSKGAVQLREGDILKLGKLKLKVAGIVLTEQQKNQRLQTQSSHSEDSQSREEYFCRICFEKSARLISPCNCKGSLKYIHEDCLRDWINNSLEERVSEDYVHYCWVNKCELCCSCFEFNPRTFVAQLPHPPFVIVETTRQEKIHLIGATISSKFIIGRFAESSIIVKDNSVSRIHCRLYLQDGKLMVEDCGSKYGTLKLIKQSTVAVPPRGLIVQSGKHVVRVAHSLECHCSKPDEA